MISSHRFRFTDKIEQLWSRQLIPRDDVCFPHFFCGSWPPWPTTQQLRFCLQMPPAFPRRRCIKPIATVKKWFGLLTLRNGSVDWFLLWMIIMFRYFQLLLKGVFLISLLPVTTEIGHYRFIAGMFFTDLYGRLLQEWSSKHLSRTVERLPRDNRCEEMFGLLTSNI